RSERPRSCDARRRHRGTPCRRRVALRLEAEGTRPPYRDGEGDEREPMTAQREWFEKDYYAVLGVPSSATAKELSRAYKKLAKEHHPDINPGNKVAEERFKEVNAAYDVLGDAEKRTEYDEVRRMVGASRCGRAKSRCACRPASPTGSASASRDAARPEPTAARRATSSSWCT